MRSRASDPAQAGWALTLWVAASRRLHLRALKALARLIAVCAPLTLVMATPPADALSEQAPAPKPASAERAAAPEATNSTPAKAAPETSEAVHFYTRTASEAWIDRLSHARRRVLSARHSFDEANAAYARALYEKMPEGEQLRALASHRTSANAELAKALEAVPGLVERARSDGVSPEVLELYEDSIPR